MRSREKLMKEMLQQEKKMTYKQILYSVLFENTPVGDPTNSAGRRVSRPFEKKKLASKVSDPVQGILRKYGGRKGNISKKNKNARASLARRDSANTNRRNRANFAPGGKYYGKQSYGRADSTLEPVFEFLWDNKDNIDVIKTFKNRDQLLYLVEHIISLYEDGWYEFDDMYINMEGRSVSKEFWSLNEGRLELNGHGNLKGDIEWLRKIKKTLMQN